MQVDKKGKKFKMRKSNILFFDAGTVDKTTMKSIYLGFSGHFISISDNTLEAVRIMNWNIKQIISKYVKESPFQDKYILYLDIPKSLEETNKAFFSFQLTLYPKQTPFEFKAWLNSLCDTIENFCSYSDYFVISNKRKKNKF